MYAEVGDSPGAPRDVPGRAAGTDGPFSTGRLRGFAFSFPQLVLPILAVRRKSNIDKSTEELVLMVGTLAILLHGVTRFVAGGAFKFCVVLLETP